MRLLLIGGTWWLGREIVTVALARGHAVTLFNRGRTDPGVFAGDVETVLGDRERPEDLDRLLGRRFDAVIDTCGYAPETVGASARALAGAVDLYTFVSSISAYRTFPRPGLTEEDPVEEAEDPGDDYGALKAACERAVRAALEDRALVVRPGLIVGPGDPSERFTYWVRRLAAGGTVLVPDAARQPVQFIDVRDLAAFIVRVVEDRRTGTLNVTGPADPLAFSAMIEAIHAAVGGAAELAWTPEADLAAAGAEPWSELPLWLDVERNPGFAGFLAVDLTQALRDGLRLRPLADTARDTLTWERSRGPLLAKRFGAPLAPAGMTPEREHELLASFAL